MDLNNYKNILKTAPFGYAYHKVILNELGVPIDYIFIEVNHEFEKLTGLKSEIILNKSIKTVIPEIEDDEFDWIEFYGEVALCGEQKEFEQFSKVLNKFYKVQVYSPEKYFFSTVFIDITKERIEKLERIETEEKLRESEDNLRLIFENNSAAMLLIEQDSTISMVNREFCKISGYEIEDVIGKSWTFFIPESDLPRLQEYNRLRILNPKEAPNKYEFTFYQPSGTIKYALMSVSVLRNKKIIASFLDITDRIKAEQELNYNRAFLSDLIDNNGALIYVKDLAGNYELVNKKWEEVTGFTKEQAIGKSDFSLFPGDVGINFRNIDQHVIQQNQIIEIEEILNDSSGNRYFLSTKFPILDMNNQVKGICGLSTEITQRKIVEKALMESEEKIRLIFNNANIGFSITDTTGKYLMCNNWWLEKLEYTEVEILQLNKIQVTHPDDIDISKELFNKFVNLEIDSYHIEKKYISKSGKIFYGELAVSGIKDSNNRIVNAIGIVNDITERVQALEQLKESEEKHRIIFTDSPDAYLIIKNGIFVDCNKSTEKMLGCSRDLIIGRTPESLSPEYQPDGKRSSVSAGEKIEEALRTGNSTFEWVHTKFDGPNFFVEVSIATIWIDGDKALFTSWRDITARKLAEEKLRDSESHYRLLTEGVSDVVWTQDKNNFYTYISPADERLRGFKAEEIVGKHVFDVMTEKGVIAVKEAMKRRSLALNAGEKNDSLTILAQQPCKDGTFIWSEIISSPVFDESGEIVGFHGISRDVSQRKQVEEAILKLSKAVEHSPVSIVITDIHGVIEYVNPKFCEITGYSKEEIIGDTHNILNSGKMPKEFFTNLWDTILAGKEWHGELVNRRKNGEDYWGYSSISPIMNEYGNITHFIAIKEDITDRKFVEEQLKHKNIELAELNASKDKFFSILAHDIKSPFAGFLGLTKIIAEEYQNLTMKEVQEFGKNMQESATNLFKLLENLLEWSRMQRGVTEFNPESFLLSFIVQQNVDVQSVIANQKNITLKNNIDSDFYAYADVSMLNTVFRNLISNALKFTNINGAIEIGSSIFPNDNNYILIYVKDTGIGIPDSIIEKLFKIDQKVSRPGTEGEPSTGLGLLLCMEFIEKHGGKIWVESKVDEGSIFNFTLPIAQII